MAAIDTSECRQTTCCSPSDLDHVSTGEDNCPDGYVWNGFECVPAECVITTTELAGGTVGVPYSESLSVDMDLPNADWSLSGGALPDGLTLNIDGTITGTPTTAGTFVFTVKATPTA